MIENLNLNFNDEERAILDKYIEKYNQEISVFYSIDTEKITGAETPNRMIFVGGLYLLEEKGSPNEWHMGHLLNGVYDFWGNYRDLENALYGL